MIRYLITDFDGTLVDTFEANYRAYCEAFETVGLTLSRDQYRECFGLRFDNFMKAMGIESDEIKHRIKEIKGEVYPKYFDYLNVNRYLFEFIWAFHRAGGKTAIASTAREKNLRNALRHIGAENDFDLILAGESVSKGKPDPEIYLKALERLGASPDEALIFEDSEVGCKAAEAAGVRFIKITKDYFN